MLVSSVAWHIAVCGAAVGTAVWNRLQLTNNWRSAFQKASRRITSDPLPQTGNAGSGSDEGCFKKYYMEWIWSEILVKLSSTYPKRCLVKSIFSWQCLTAWDFPVERCVCWEGQLSAEMDDSVWPFDLDLSVHWTSWLPDNSVSGVTTLCCICSL